MDVSTRRSIGWRRCIARWLATLPGWLALSAIAGAQQRVDLDPFFESKVRPILANRCWKCHSGEAGENEGGLRLDHGSLILRGGDSGPAIVAGNPDASLIYQAVMRRGYEMPPDTPLPADEIEVLRTWIERGGAWPDEPLPEDRADRPAFDLEFRRASHWAWQPRDLSSRSRLAADPWSRSPLDSYIAHQARAAGLEPSPRADRITLARRLYLDLIGIPPQADEIARIQADPRPDWDAAIVDALLADPQFGARWARHWMDLVRFAQSRGHEFDEDIPAGEAYRDYVVRAFNADLPYDRFLVEHIAGDLLESPRVNERDGFNESVLATGFWHFGDWVHSPVDTRKDETDRFDNMVDVASKTFLGVTVACARCHDHKFDAISTEDYYAMFGYLRSSHYRLVRYETDLAHRGASAQLEALRQPLQQEAAQTLREMAEAWITATDSVKLDEEPAATLVERCRGWLDAAHRRYGAHDPRVVFDARTPDLSLWQSDGVLYGPTSRRPLTTSINIRSQSAPWTMHPMDEGARDRFWDPMTQNVEGVNRQNRYAQIAEAGKILPTKMFTLQSGKLSYLVRGSFRSFASVDSHRLVAGPLHGETLFESAGAGDAYRWVTHSLDRYKGKTICLEFSPIGDNDFGIVQVVDGLPPEPVPASPQTPMQLFDAARSAVQACVSNPGSMSDAQLALCAAVLQDLANRPTKWLGEEHALARQIHQLETRWRDAETRLADSLPWKSKLAMAMRDGSGINDSVLIRGNHLRPGQEVRRRNLQALAPSRTPFDGQGSGRLALAQQWTEPSNPLVSRVIVNRVWHHLLGRGLAATTDDLGVLGTPPTHPELLDRLAEDFIEQGWSIKALVRQICLSQTYQQDSRSNPRAQQTDPNNELLSHARVRRLEAEAVRDTLLAVTGELDLRWMPDHEPSVPVHLTEFLEGRGRPSRNGPMDGRGRRSVYLEVRRNFLHPMMTAFDMPNPFSSMGRRNVSNVPAQALILLNDPFVHALASRWADRIIGEYPTEDQRVRAMLVQISLREPTSPQIQDAIAFLHAPGFANASEAYHALAHMLLNRKELLFRF